VFEGTSFGYPCLEYTALVQSPKSKSIPRLLALVVVLFAFNNWGCSFAMIGWDVDQGAHTQVGP
jgi:hypothetical protein